MIFVSIRQIAVLTSAVSLYNLDEYILKTYDVKSDEAFLYLKTGSIWLFYRRRDADYRMIIKSFRIISPDFYDSADTKLFYSFFQLDLSSWRVSWRSTFWIWWLVFRSSWAPCRRRRTCSFPICCLRLSTFSFMSRWALGSSLRPSTTRYATVWWPSSWFLSTFTASSWCIDCTASWSSASKTTRSSCARPTVSSNKRRTTRRPTWKFHEET